MEWSGVGWGGVGWSGVEWSGHSIFSILFRTILTVHFYKKHFISVEILMFPVKRFYKSVR